MHITVPLWPLALRGGVKTGGHSLACCANQGLSLCPLPREASLPLCPSLLRTLCSSPPVLRCAAVIVPFVSIPFTHPLQLTPSPGLRRCHCAGCTAPLASLDLLGTQYNACMCAAAPMVCPQGGGFCGARTRPLPQSDWSAYDGLALRVKGDGQIFKFNIKTVSVMGDGQVFRSSIKRVHEQPQPRPCRRRLAERPICCLGMLRLDEHACSRVLLAGQETPPGRASLRPGPPSTHALLGKEQGVHAAVVEDGACCGGCGWRSLLWMRMVGAGIPRHPALTPDGHVCLVQVDQVNTPESTYQATFDTVDGQWHDVLLPWHNFVPVKRAQSDPDGEWPAVVHRAKRVRLVPFPWRGRASVSCAGHKRRWPRGSLSLGIACHTIHPPACARCHRSAPEPQLKHLPLVM